MYACLYVPGSHCWERKRFWNTGLLETQSYRNKIIPKLIDHWLHWYQILTFLHSSFGCGGGANPCKTELTWLYSTKGKMAENYEPIEKIRKTNKNAQKCLTV